MKKNTFLTFITLLLFNSVNAQVLLNDNFNNYTLGNLGTDPTGMIPGQGGWLTKLDNTTTANNSAFTVTNEIFRGKVITLTTPKDKNIFVTKDLNILIDQRTKGNDVIKFEIDYYTGSKYYIGSSNPPYSHISFLYNGTGYRLFEISHHLMSQVGTISASFCDGLTENHGVVRLGDGAWYGYDQLPADTWVTFIVYLDYTNKKIYFETPYFNKVTVGDFLNKSTSTNLMKDFKPTVVSLHTSADISNASQMDHKYDNIKITALKVVPPNIIALSINEHLGQRFNLYPNPAANFVNITNNENMSVKQIEIYDLAGKLINTKNFNNETEIQLNIETLTSGTYLLHLHTDEGTAVKKLIKK